MTAVPIDELPRTGPAVVTLGVFDGVHLGHQHVLRSTVAAARERGARAMALVFSPHPDEVLRPGTRVERLLPPEETLARLIAAGADHALEIRFDETLRAMAPEDFLAALGASMELRAVVMSADSAFGRGRAGTPERVEEIGAERGFDAITVEPLTVGGQAVSSSRIRDALRAGELDVVRELLAGPPMLRGVVITGDRRGRTLGFPTANLAFGAYTPTLPALGIYLGAVRVPDRDVTPGHPALVSVGVRPTFHDAGQVLVESYLLDWDGDLYGSTMDVELRARLRDELRFASVEELVAQMQADELEARRRLGLEPT